MGTEQKRIVVTTSVSRHNAPKDHIHEALHDLLTAEINAVVKDRKYEPIRPELENWMGY